MLRITNLIKAYKKEMAVNNVSLVIDDGIIGIIMGPNGAGKSTLIKCVCGLLNYKGEIFVGDAINTSVEGKNKLSYAPEMPVCFSSLTVDENIEFICKAYSKDYNLEVVNYYLELFELTDKRKKLSQDLSKGMLQKLSIIMSLIIEPEVLLLDEPFIGLDPKAIRELKKLILKLRSEGVSILISTHMIDTVKELYDKAFIMKSGILLKSFTKEQVGEDEIESVFFEATNGGDANESN